MQGQLDEMRKQREFTIAQIRGSLKRERMQYQHINEFGYPVPPTEIFSGWAFNAIWTNVGATAAKNVTSWSSLSIKNRTTEKNWSDVLKRPDHPNVPFSSSGHRRKGWYSHRGRYERCEECNRASNRSSSKRLSIFLWSHSIQRCFSRYSSSLFRMVRPCDAVEYYYW